ncbi:MAG: PIN domain-containing protein, partial [Longimicrobiaceae bacterium]
MNVSHAPNAALLIDFDNVTMAIRSDLGKELKALLNSEVIRGKVSVQRAYADWRRYPQYIVPLAESSIDLIFAPAYGSAKKNATDLRMAIDAIELVFTRPEIGTYILLTGDSDFSSCVLKLKEYGKYVIGVGMRESSSDLLIQNCDEYYSYHALSGLTRADEVIESKEDPWQLVRRATQQMVANQDVMRTDRLKQVMLTMDPAFDEKKLGYTKFSRFVQEAATKGLLQLKKMENGQLEIVVDGVQQPAVAPVAERERERSESPRSRRGENGRRGRRGTSDAPRERPAPTAPAPAPITISDEAEAGVAAPVEAAPAAAPLGAPTEPHSAYALLQQALGALAGRDGKWVRDGDVKRRMLEISPEFDEGKLGFPKFSRFLRQAHDAEIIDLNRVGTGHYEVALSARAPRLAPSPAPEARVETPAARQAPTAAPQSEAAAAPAARTPIAAETPRQLGALRGRR